MSGVQAAFSILGVIIVLAGALGLAYTVFRSSSEQKLRELDKRIIENQQALISQTEAELIRERARAQAAENNAVTYRDALTQKAAVDHLLEVLVREEQARHTEHADHQREAEVSRSLLKEALEILKELRERAERLSR